MTDIAQELHCFLYHSQIAPHADIGCVADIVKTVRNFNKTQGITGLLVFDGQSFCQYIEGPQPALGELIGRIQADPRHVNFKTLHACASCAERKFEQWSMAYVLVDDTEHLADMAQEQGANALKKLHELLPLMDIA